ncbi:hypothetical protein M011DRAFT_257787 [Sporormia fimetaria CBS 119925]|uniref:Uncharacterized protein n=1 Tax=Sporormia fimetaria CBS 119925 TaxID=1340428 RepID=A0A6A6UZ94_9PLEO|nr:hypothetical protein M011DRAFT_257787 [Sporormia fimetaria CBS 119925]
MIDTRAGEESFPVFGNRYPQLHLFALDQLSPSAYGYTPAATAKPRGIPTRKLLLWSGALPFRPGSGGSQLGQVHALVKLHNNSQISQTSGGACTSRNDVRPGGSKNYFDLAFSEAGCVSCPCGPQRRGPSAGAEQTERSQRTCDNAVPAVEREDEQKKCRAERSTDKKILVSVEKAASAHAPELVAGVRVMLFPTA